MKILFVLLISVAIAVPILLMTVPTFCIVTLSSRQKEQEDEEQMKWLGEYQERTMSTCTSARKMNQLKKLKKGGKKSA